MAAVVLNLTAVAPTAGGFLTVYPAGAPRPNTSNVNFGAHQTVADEVIATLGTGGAITIFNAVGSTHILVDVTGWFAAESYYHPLTPFRALDTRSTAPVGPAGTVDVPVTGRAGIPTTASAVAFTLTAIHPSAGTFVTAYPTGQSRPHTSNLNLTANQTTAVLVVTKLGTGGKVTLYNDRGTVHLIADVTGWFSPTGQFTPITPIRVTDTRTGTPVPNGGVLDIATFGVAPPETDAFVLSVTAVAPTGTGFLSVQAFGATGTTTSTLNYTAGHTVANLAIVGPAFEPIEVHAHGSGTVHVVVDLLGWFATPIRQLDPPTLPDAALPGSYSHSLRAAGGMTPYTWTITAGALPAGLDLTPVGADSATISGTPTTHGTSTFTVRVAGPRGLFSDQTYTLTVQPFAPGAVWAWGQGSIGELGNGDIDNTPTPSRVSELSGITAIAGGDGTGYALRSDGTVWAWGNNSSGQLGDGTTTDRLTPVQVTGLTGVTAIAAGSESGYALKADGTVWAWGDNAFGEFGDGTTISRHTAVQVTGLTGVTAIAAGSLSGYALESDGTVRAWGHNAFAQLGDGTTTDRLTPVRVSGLTGIRAITSAVNSSDGYALKSDGTVWAWGDGFSGKRGNGSNLTDPVPNQVVGLTAVTGIAAGEGDGYAITSDGTAWAWGHNAVGQIGDGTTTDRLTPVQVTGLAGVTDIVGGDFNAFALTSDGAVWAWGQDGDELGAGRDGSRVRTTPLQVAGMPPVTALAAGGFTAYALGAATP